jgi:ribosomal protein S18 acetylase RimI-like enzyme
MSMIGQQVREALPCEFSQVADLTLASFGGPDGLRPERVAMLLDAAGRARDGLLLVAIDNETGALTGTLSLLRAGAAYARHAGPGEAELRLAAVRPAYRNRGVARALVTEAIERARGWGVTALLADTAVHNEAAQRLLLQFGFCLLLPEKVRLAVRSRPIVVFRYDLSVIT